MYTVENIVAVTFSDIINGERKIANTCPLALSIKRLHSDAKAVLVDLDTAFIWFSFDDGNHQTFDLSDSLRRFVRRYDNWPRWTRWLRRPFKIRIDYKNNIIDKA